MKIERIKVANEKKYTKDVDELISLVMQDVPAALTGGMPETSFSRLELNGPKFKILGGKS